MYIQSDSHVFDWTSPSTGQELKTHQDVVNQIGRPADGE